MRLLNEILTDRAYAGIVLFHSHNNRRLLKEQHKPADFAHIWFYLKQAEDKAEWFPIGKWATIQTIETWLNEELCDYFVPTAKVVEGTSNTRWGFSLVICPICGHQHSSAEKSCPKCAMDADYKKKLEAVLEQQRTDDRIGVPERRIEAYTEAENRGIGNRVGVADRREIRGKKINRKIS